MENHENFRNLAAAIQSIVIVLSIILGGGWAYVKFVILKEAETAEARHASLERDSKDYRVVNVSLTPSFECLDRGNGYLIIAKVNFHNDGNATEVIDLSGASITVHRPEIDMATVKFDPAPEQIIGRLSVLANNYPEKKLRLKPKADIERIFVARVRQSGPYLLRFAAIASKLEQDLASGEGVNTGIVWAGENVLSIPKNACEL